MRLLEVMNELYYQYSFEVPDNCDKDIVISILGDYDFEGFVETDNGFLAYIPQSKDNLEWLESIKKIDENISFSKDVIYPKNWNEEWEKNYEVAVINEECEVYASFHKAKPSVSYPLFIDPKMSFGTGHHPTTYMMCNLLFEIKDELQNKRVIDVGCGTGILGILAKKIGANEIVFIDNDAVCVENTLENIQKNIPSSDYEKMQVKQATIQEYVKQNPEEKFDVVIANIQRDVILNDMPLYKSILKPNGYLLVSGILEKYEQEIAESAQPLQHIKTLHKNEWISLLFYHHS
ncbi:MAG: ribosomal protein L11 methyltransferase [Bacteroidia bacterium]|nr:MAG: ribosomal protein L11 methyltransferase [Bacteroidia bacterium]